MRIIIKTGLMVTSLGWMLMTSPAMSQSVIEAPPMDGSDTQSRTPTTGMPDPYLWHVTGLPKGSDLPVLSGAGPNFRIINTLNEGTPVDRQNCMESRGGYWCRIATYDRPRISGWVDGRFLKKTGGEPDDSPDDTIGGVPGGPYLDMPIRPKRDKYGNWQVPNAFGSDKNSGNE
ncbi:SH3 domain-containing protein [Rhizobium oryziradicis]|uniref:SH3b domain-containing protein n=1 Tax=Rhizobium oryziradicis TaxID=1867956 RepID=A0A1Q8ZWU2_9HYPH|nr:SH3 domain-containing protein [Rhizobium oryziradicis]OLP46555.1 hypothetical protein BJF95_16325 [Rhizobium oryziradicis]